MYTTNSYTIQNDGYSVGDEVFTREKSHEWWSALLMLLSSQPLHESLSPPYCVDAGYIHGPPKTDLHLTCRDF